MTNAAAQNDDDTDAQVPILTAGAVIAPGWPLFP
jgi:hypothetical protein